MARLGMGMAICLASQALHLPRVVAVRNVMHMRYMCSGASSSRSFRVPAHPTIIGSRPAAGPRTRCLAHLLHQFTSVSQSCRRRCPRMQPPC
ncbi:hypothetical protein BJ912DRAFT_410090 [Pholiota molesta]|nr:hypothetical protein BJ912DRAFT_410090 [Pholiota molesta]